MTKVFSAIAAAIAILLVSACSETPTGTTAANDSSVKASETANSGPVPAIAAYWKMYESAYKWAPDEVLLKLGPKDAAALTSGGGKAEVWEATFASPSKHEYRELIYATAAHPPDIYQGVNVGHAIPWGGVNRDVMPIEKSQFTVDSDAAFKAATDDAKAWLKKNPDKKLSNFQLGNGYSFPAPVWFVMWGDKKVGYVAYVNATTGKVMKKK
jgi:hypothetical protein